MKLEQSQIAKLENFLEKFKSQTYPEPSSPLHTQITHQMFAKFLCHPMLKYWISDAVKEWLCNYLKVEALTRSALPSTVKM